MIRHWVPLSSDRRRHEKGKHWNRRQIGSSGKKLTSGVDHLCMLGIVELVTVRNRLLLPRVGISSTIQLKAHRECGLIKQPVVREALLLIVFQRDICKINSQHESL